MDNAAHGIACERKQECTAAAQQTGALLAHPHAVHDLAEHSLHYGLRDDALVGYPVEQFSAVDKGSNQVNSLACAGFHVVEPAGENERIYERIYERMN